MIKILNENKENKQDELNSLLGMELTNTQLSKIKSDWKAVYDDPSKFKNSSVVKKMVKQYLSESISLKENKKDKDMTKIIKIEVNDFYGEFEKLLKQIKDSSDPGHTFNVVVDPEENKHKLKFEMDGDGSFIIEKIEVDYKEKDGEEDKGDEDNE